MQANQARKTVSKFPLRLALSMRKVAEEFSQREGVSLNQFINIAVAEKLAVLKHEAWLASLPKPTPELIARGLAALDRPTGIEPEPWDQLPEGYVSIRESEEYKRLLEAK